MLPGRVLDDHCVSLISTPSPPQGSTERAWPVIGLVEPHISQGDSKSPACAVSSDLTHSTVWKIKSLGTQRHEQQRVLSV